MKRGFVYLFLAFMSIGLAFAQDSSCSAIFFDKYNNQKLGTKGVDFAIEIIDNDSITSLYQVKADTLYVLFYDPYCEHCHKELKKLKRDKHLNKAIKEKTIAVLTIPPDISREEWLENVKKMPKQWLNAWSKDADILIKKYLWKVPELFVFDKDKTICKIEMYREEKE